LGIVTNPGYGVKVMVKFPPVGVISTMLAGIVSECEPPPGLEPLGFDGDLLQDRKLHNRQAAKTFKRLNRILFMQY
jgi:hypothetical protein